MGKKWKLLRWYKLLIEVGGVNSNHKLYVALDLCSELILGKDWLNDYREQLKFDPATLIVHRVEVPLEDSSNDAWPLVAEADSYPTPRTAISCGNRIATKRKLYQVAPTEKYSKNKKTKTVRVCRKGFWYLHNDCCSTRTYGLYNLWLTTFYFVAVITCSIWLHKISSWHREYGSWHM